MGGGGGGANTSEGGWCDNPPSMVGRFLKIKMG